MKIQILDKEAKKVKEIESDIFDEKIREDIVTKIAEVEKAWRKKIYAPNFLAGMQTSASGNVRHLRHAWKSDRGRGLSRVPKKRMSSRGERFVWEGAVSPNTKGGRRAHPPKTARKLGKINKKELIKGLRIALAMSASLELLKQKYSSLKDKKIDIKLPLVIEKKVLELKTKDFLKALEKIVKEAYEITLKKRKIRSGIGKMRNRRYKKSAGMLLITGIKEDKKINGLDIIKANDLTISDLASNGARLCIFTEEAIKEMEEKLK